MITPGTSDDLKQLSSLLLSVAKVWDESESDPVLSSSFSLMSGTLLGLLGDYRSGISLLKKVIYKNINSIDYLNCLSDINDGMMKILRFECVSALSHTHLLYAYYLSFSLPPCLSFSLSHSPHSAILLYLNTHPHPLPPSVPLSQTISSMEDHRAARVDILLHCPQDSRDVLALQRQSMSVRPDATSWLHGEKRLGGHAFAGYGIFGHSSSADRADQALAELHTDMTVTYLRLEIQYAIQQKRARTAFKIIDTKPPGTAAITPKTGIKMKDPGSDNLALAPLSTLNAENLSCISFLKSVCGKNCYTKSLLYMELARVEEGTDSRAEYLQVSGDWNPRFKVLQYYYLKK